MYRQNFFKGRNMEKKLKQWIKFSSMGRGLLAFLAIGFLGFTIISCSSQKKEGITTTPENTSQNLNNDQVLKFEPVEKPEEDIQAVENANDNGNDNTSFYDIDDETWDIPTDLLQEIRQALLVENYPRVLTLVEGRTDDASIYYRGIAYFVMMQEDKKYDIEERIGYARRAEQILEDVANNTTYPELRTRALLWYGVTLIANYEEFPPLKKAVSSLYQIGRYPNSKVYNDSIYYMGNAHAKLGWYGPARYYYKKVRNLDQKDDNVYDYINKTFYSTYDASEAGLRRLEAYMSGQHPDYKYDPNY